MANKSMALSDSQVSTDIKQSTASCLTSQQSTAEDSVSNAAFGRKLVGLIEKYNRMLESARGAELDDLVSYVNFMAAKKEPLFVLLKGEEIDAA